MAHFAELDSNNQVINVVVVSNDDVTANGGDQSSGAETWVDNNIPHTTGGVSWKQTSFNHNFRKQYATIDNSYYDAAKDKFILNQPHASWTLDANDDWQAPHASPADTDGNVTFDNNGTSVTLREVGWDEENTRWTGTTALGATYDVWYYNNSTNTWTFDKTVTA